jgi:hypothetical protein
VLRNTTSYSLGVVYFLALNKIRCGPVITKTRLEDVLKAGISIPSGSSFFVSHSYWTGSDAYSVTCPVVTSDLLVGSKTSPV